MLTPLALLTLAPLLAAPTPSPTTLAKTVVQSAVVDSTPAPLTEELITGYIGVKKDLGPYWKDHQDAFNAAKTKDIKTPVQVGSQTLQIGSFDYPTIVAKDTAVAAIFKKHSFPADKFTSTQAAAFLAVGQIVTNQSPDASSVAGKNFALVKKHQQELAAVGVALQTGGGGMGGGNDDLNP